MIKKVKVLTLVLLCIASNFFGQTSYTSEQDVLNAKSLTFYGFDFTQLRVNDTKRMGQKLKQHLFYLTGELTEHLPEKKLQKWAEIPQVTYNIQTTIDANKKIVDEDIAVVKKSTINKDIIPSLINGYNYSEKEGIGFVIIYECFDEPTKCVSAYGVYFDIATKKILLVDYAVRHDSNSFNQMRDWTNPAFGVIKDLCDMRLAKLKPTRK